MKKNHPWHKCFVIFITIFSFSCHQEKKHLVAESTTDCFKKFIEASLQGDKEKANAYLLQDSLNITLFNDWHQKYSQLSAAEKRNYASASIIILKDSVWNDSMSTITYYNSHKKIPIQIKIYRIDKKYLVDIKHTFYGNT